MSDTYTSEDARFDAEELGRCGLCGRYPSDCGHCKCCGRKGPRHAKFCELFESEDAE